MNESRYRAVKAYKNQAFLGSPAARSLRIVSEYLEPDSRVRDLRVRDTIVVFGSARIVSRTEGQRLVDEARAGKGDLARLGNNVMLAADPRTGEVRRFLTGPAGCEVTGATGTPDGRTMFINIQHPGESPSERSEPDQVRRISNWPDFRPDGRPRSATVVIRRNDGGVVGT